MRTEIFLRPTVAAAVTTAQPQRQRCIGHKSAHPTPLFPYLPFPIFISASLCSPHQARNLYFFLRVVGCRFRPAQRAPRKFNIHHLHTLTTSNLAISNPGTEKMTTSFACRFLLFLLIASAAYFSCAFELKTLVRY
jgi:hypothetical protein